MFRMSAAIALLFAALLTVSGFSACTSTGDADSTARRQALAELGVRVAAIEFIGQDAERAERVKTVATLAAVALAGGKAATVYELAALVEDQIDWSRYEPMQAALGQGLIQLVAEDLIRLSGDREVAALSPEVREKAARYLQLVADVAGASLAR